MGTQVVEEGSGEVRAGRPIVEALAPAALARLMMSRGVEEDGHLMGAPVPRPMTAYRGFADLRSAFGTDDPEAIAPGPHPVPGQMVLAHGRCLLPPVPSEEFGAVLECYLPVGMQATWIAGSGDPSTLEGADIVLVESPALLITGHRTELSTPVISAEASCR